MATRPTRARSTAAPTEVVARTTCATSWLGGVWRALCGPHPLRALLALWPAWWALWLAAERFPPWPQFLLVTLAVWLAQPLGAFLGERIGGWLDAGTRKSSPSASAGEVLRGREALLFAVALTLVLAGVLLLGGALAFWMGLGALGFALAHPFVRRYSYLAQAFLGVACGWAAALAFAAVQGGVSALGWLLACAGSLWMIGCLLWQAMADRAEDLRCGRRSTAILLGEMDLPALALVSVGALVALVLVGQRAPLAMGYLAGLALAALLAGVQFWLARGRGREGCLRALALGNASGAAVLAGIVLAKVLGGAQGLA